MLTPNITRQKRNIMPETVVENVHSYHAIKLKQIVLRYHEENKETSTLEWNLICYQI